MSLGAVLLGYGLLSNKASAYAMLALATKLGLALQSSMPIFGATLVWSLIAVCRVNAPKIPTLALSPRRPPP